MNVEANVKWLDEQTPCSVSSVEGLDRELNRIAETCDGDPPLIVTVYVHGFELGLGLGLPQSFVHVEELSGQSPYFFTVGDSNAEGRIAFFLHGNHHTEISRRNLVPIQEAREVVREFFQTARRSSKVSWEEV